MRNTVVLLMVSLQLVRGYGGYSATPAPDHYSGAVGGGQESRAASLVAYGQEPVQDTPEVTRAKQEHLAAVARAKALIGAGGAPLQPVVDTPEVAAARARHLAIVQGAHAQARIDVHPPQTVSWSTPAPGVVVTGSPSAYSTVASVHQQWGVSSTPAPVHDTVEVAAAKAKHLAAVEEAKARLASASSYSHQAAAQTHQYSGGEHPDLIKSHQQAVTMEFPQQPYSSITLNTYSSHQAGYAVPPAAPAAPAPVQDTVEVAAAKAQHLAAVSQAAARVSQSIASQYAAPRSPTFHYPNVPGELPRFPAPAPALSRAAAPAWQAPEVRYNTVSEEGGQYVPDDEGRYYSNQNDEGQYDARLDAEGQYDPRLNDEGQYIPSLNDEGQWVPSANEGQYIPGPGDQDQGEDNMPYSYSYSDGLSSKTETKTADGITRGRFSYVDANGVLQAVEYQADNVYGFRASGTNLPQPPVAAPAAPAAPARTYQPPAAAYPAVSSYAVPAYRAPVAAYGAPAPPRPIAAAYGTPVAVPSIALAAPDVPADTPEVAAAKAAHFAAHREAGARLASAYGR